MRPFRQGRTRVQTLPRRPARARVHRSAPTTGPAELAVPGPVARPPTGPMFLRCGCGTGTPASGLYWRSGSSRCGFIATSIASVADAGPTNNTLDRDSDDHVPFCMEISGKENRPLRHSRHSLPNPSSAGETNGLQVAYLESFEDDTLLSLDRCCQEFLPLCTQHDTSFRHFVLRRTCGASADSAG